MYSLIKLLAVAVNMLIYLRPCKTLLLDSCVTPPLECPNKNVTFWLYTRANKDNPHELKYSDPSTIEQAPWVPNAAIKILIHGYTGHKDFAPNTQIRPAYFECCNYNIISIDYNPIVQEPCYFQAATNTELVGKCTAQLIDEMVNNHRIQLSKIHVIGFSLGAHVAGFIGNYLTTGKLERITGLDPALPLFATAESKMKIDATDAKTVDILHTNALQKGKLEVSGQADFFANGGTKQPGCSPDENLTVSGCMHERAPVYYAESITTKIGFYGKKCHSWISYIIGLCDFFTTDEEVLFGEYMPLNASGLFFFNTNSEYPFAQGSSKSDKTYENIEDNGI